ncbi:hypothetical protein EF903_27230 [Streptomyces sp. WAC05292]|nr:hypothetical protein EF903_27230 [Streptomyces sp. WAC05292]
MVGVGQGVVDVEDGQRPAVRALTHTGHPRLAGRESPRPPGGVMLPNHQPLLVAEQFGVLESLFPGRPAPHVAVSGPPPRRRPGGSSTSPPRAGRRPPRARAAASRRCARPPRSSPWP